MELMDVIHARRSIRRYRDEQLSREVLERILEAGTWAANAGGGQRSMIVGIRDASLVTRLGRMNLARFDRSRLSGNFVSKEQPSVIDDPAISNGFYGAPALAAVFAQRDFFFGVPDAFCCAQAMALAAYDLGVASCIVSRAEETFDCPEGHELLRAWGVPEDYAPRCFLALGYCDGPYPGPKPRRAGRVKIIE